MMRQGRLAVNQQMWNQLNARGGYQDRHTRKPPSHLRLLRHGWPAICAILVSASPHAFAIDPLPKEVPERTVSIGELIREATTSLELIDDRRERFSILGPLLVVIPVQPEEECKLLKEFVIRESKAADSPEWFERCRDELARAMPELAFDVALRLKGQSIRETCLMAVVEATATNNPALAQRAVSEIQGRPLGALGVIAAQTGTLSDVKKHLAAVRQADYRPYQPPQLANVYAAFLDRFLQDHFDEVVACICADLSPDDATDALGQLAGVQMLGIHTQYPKEPPTSARLLKVAGDLVPRCKDPASATEKLLQKGFAIHYPPLALEYFDRFLVEKINRQIAAELLRD